MRLPPIQRAARGFVAVCWERSQQNEAVRFATELRRRGEVTDLALSGRAQKQFDKAKAAGSTVIATVTEPGKCRLWRAWSPSIDAEIADVLHWLDWIEDETDLLPDPPAYILTEPPQ